MINIGLDSTTRNSDVWIQPRLVEAVFLLTKDGDQVLPDKVTCVRLMSGRVYGVMAPIDVVAKKIDDAN